MEELELTPEYLQAFNDGYLIAKHLPELSAKLSDVKSISPKLIGMKDGRDQYISEFEKEKDFLPNWLKAKNKTEIKDKNNSKDLDKE